MTAFVWTDNASGNELWNDQLNWNGGASGFPDDADDNATFDGTWTADCDINVIVVVGQINMSAGYTGKITCNNRIALDNSGVYDGNLNLAAGEIDGGAVEIEIDGDWNNTGGTFTHGDGFVTFNFTSQA